MSLPTKVQYELPTSAEVPASAVPWSPDPERMTLLVHDMQRHFLTPYDPQTEPIGPVVNGIAELVAAARDAGIPVVYTAQPPHQEPEQRGLLTDFWGTGLADAGAAQIADPVAPSDSDAVLTKWRYDAFAKTDLETRLRESGRDQLAIVGVYTHIGCLATAMRAFMCDIQPFVVADATADFSRGDHLMALDYVSRRCGVVTTAQELIEAWRLDAAGSEVSVADVTALAAELLAVEPSEIGPEQNLLDEGFDSVRIMALADRLSTTACEVGFMDLAADLTPAAVAATVNRLREQVSADVRV